MYNLCTLVSMCNSYKFMLSFNLLLILLFNHEIVGTVVEVRSEVKNFVVGDQVGMGCIVQSFHHCDSCKKGQEQYCEEVIWMYERIDIDGSVTID